MPRTKRPTETDYQFAYSFFRALNLLHGMGGCSDAAATVDAEFLERARKELAHRFGKPSPLAPWKTEATSRFDKLLNDAKGEPIKQLLDRVRAEIRELVPIFRAALEAAAPKLWQEKLGSTPDQMDATLAELPALSHNDAWACVQKLDNDLKHVGMRPVYDDPKANTGTRPKETPTNTVGYKSAAWLEDTYKMRPSELSRKARAKRVRTRPALPGYVDENGIRRYKLYHVEDARKYCAPKRNRDD